MKLIAFPTLFGVYNYIKIQVYTRFVGRWKIRGCDLNVAWLQNNSMMTQTPNSPGLIFLHSLSTINQGDLMMLLASLLLLKFLMILKVKWKTNMENDSTQNSCVLVKTDTWQKNAPGDLRRKVSQVCPWESATCFLYLHINKSVPHHPKEIPMQTCVTKDLLGRVLETITCNEKERRGVQVYQGLWSIPRKAWQLERSL